MRKYFINLNVIIIFGIFFSSEIGYAQLGFCQGNSGDPIFVEDFGIGLTDIPLPAGTTTYNYANGGEPLDGLYTVSSNTNYFDWFDVEDHTPSDADGRMLVVNSSFSAGEFYRATINGLCENTSYEFSSWIVNLTPSGGFCGAGAIPVNVRFEIWDSTDTNLLASGNTGNINSSSTPIWDQYALVFQTIPGQTSVILKMINNGSGGCGNDLGIDDIVFKSCGDFIEVNDTVSNDSVTLCSSETPYDTILTATPDNAVFSNHFYQWQESLDNTIWIDIAGATSNVLNLTGVTTTTYYRAKVAEFAANLSNLDCITFSTTYEIIINQAPNAPTIECWETATLNSTTCTWDITGTQPTAPTGLECWETTTFNTTTCAWEVSGTQPIHPNIECWETATFNTVTCNWEITGIQPTQPTGLECWESTSFNTMTCNWEISGTQPIQPTTECWETATFNTTTCLWEVSGTQPTQPTLECWEMVMFNNTTCSWEILGTQPLEPTNLECWETTTFNTATCSWEVLGTQPEEPTDLECWEMTSFNSTSCSWEITGTQIVDTEELFITICENEDITLEANTDITNATYLWNSGETTQTISVSTSGTYIVVSTDGCSTIEKTIYVEAQETLSIESVQSDGNDIIVFTSSSGDFLYSLDGVNFQTNNIFYDIDGGKYTIYVKSIDCDAIVTATHLHFFIPKFFTPNNDGSHDTFSLFGIDCFASSEVYIYNRYGKLLFSAYNSPANWNGTMNGKALPTSDYWYLIIIEGQEFRGHFTLKR